MHVLLFTISRFGEGLSNSLNEALMSGLAVAATADAAATGSGSRRFPAQWCAHRAARPLPPPARIANFVEKGASPRPAHAALIVTRRVRPAT
jgi:hypothetical protein